MAEFEVRFYRPGDEEGIVTLFKEIFGRGMSIDEWRWKYKSFGEEVYSVVGEDSRGEIVAHYGLLPRRMVFEGNEGRTVMIADVMVRPGFRGMKSLKKLVKFPEEPVRARGVPFGYGFPSENTLMLPAEKMGLFERVEDVMEAAKSIKPAGFDLRRWAFDLFDLSYHDERIDTLWREFKDTFPVMIIRDRKFLEWRYGRHPLYSYQLLGFRKRWRQKLIGLAVLRRSNEEESLLMDFVCKKSCFGFLLREVEDFVSSTFRTNVIKLWIPPMLAEDFRDRGYSINPAGTSIPLTTHAATFRKEQIKNRFFYTMGDTDFL